MQEVEDFKIWVEKTKAMIAQSDVEEIGPISDDPREAYMRGIESGLVFALVLCTQPVAVPIVNARD